MNNIRVWIAGNKLESHREIENSYKFIEELGRHNIEVVDRPNSRTDILFCGSFYNSQELMRYYRRFNYMPIVHYVWDLYPFKLDGSDAGDSDVIKTWWREYLESIVKAKHIIVPSAPVVERVKQYCNKDSTIIHSSVYAYDEPTYDGEYVLDPVRKYPDQNMNAVSEACSKLGLKCVETKNSLTYSDFKKVVAGARVIVSAQYEASTGGLSTLEGYALGKQILLSRSPRHGGVDYFGNKASYFNWYNKNELLDKIEFLYKHYPIHEKTVNKVQCKHWVESTYNDVNMCRKLRSVFERVLES